MMLVNTGPSYIIGAQITGMSSVNSCRICHLIVWVMSEVVPRMHVWYSPLCQRMHVCHWTDQLGTQSLRVIGILLGGLESNHYNTRNGKNTHSKWQNKGKSTEQELCMTRQDWVEDSTQSVWNVCRTFKTVCLIRKKMLFWIKMALKGNHV